MKSRAAGLATALLVPAACAAPTRDDGSTRRELVAQADAWDKARLGSEK